MECSGQLWGEQGLTATVASNPDVTNVIGVGVQANQGLAQVVGADGVKQKFPSISKPLIGAASLASGGSPSDRWQHRR